MSERWLHVRPGRVRGYYFAVNPFDSPRDWADRGEERDDGMVEGEWWGVHSACGVSSEKMADGTGKARGGFDGLIKRIHRAKVKARRSGRSIAQAPWLPCSGIARAVFGDGRGKGERRFCDPGAAVSSTFFSPSGEIALLFSRGCPHANAA